jgi:C_GCAxxG_C_C family probable redox protein
MSQKKSPQAVEIPQSEAWVLEVREKASDYMKKSESCAQSILKAFMDQLGIGDPLVIRSAGAMHGGMLSSRVCGVHTGGLMVLGLLVGREDLEEGLDGLFPIVMPAQDLFQRLTARLGSSSCKELTGVDFTDLGKAMEFLNSPDKEKCVDLVADGAEEIARFLQEQAQAGQLFRTH